MKVVIFLEFREVLVHFDVVAEKVLKKFDFFRISRRMLVVMPLGFLA